MCIPNHYNKICPRDLGYYKDFNDISLMELIVKKKKSLINVNFTVNIGCKPLIANNCNLTHV